MKGNFIECAIRGLQINSSNARKHFDTVRAIANEYLAAREAGSPIEVLTPREELKQLRSTATPAVVQNATTAPVPRPLTYEELMEALRNGTLELVEPGTVSTPSTRTLEKLSEANAQLAEESTQLMARNAALEENALHVQAELRRREEQLVEAGKKLDGLAAKISTMAEQAVGQRTRIQELEADVARADRQYGGLHNENKELKEEVAELQRKLDDLRTEEQINAESTYEANKRAENLEWDNTRLRRALLEQATCFATTLKAILPEA
ncbi:MAG: hypothetical protein JST98_10830 [Bacteroidetes bacterium]|nr:hypothetical protein [Bacteroidota bacterium]